MGDIVLAALRISGRRSGISYRSSKSFRNAVDAAMTMHGELLTGRAAAEADAEFDLRSQQVLRGMALQRDLEVAHHLPHRRFAVAVSSSAR